MAGSTNEAFADEWAVNALLERVRWAGGIFCPHCTSPRVRRMAGRTQAGMLLCNDCRGKFTVRTGTVMERSHVPLHKWLQAARLLSLPDRSITARDLEHRLGLSYRTAWLLRRRIRLALEATPPSEQASTIEDSVIASALVRAPRAR